MLTKTKRNIMIVLGMCISVESDVVCSTFV
jgi:hypothetical protein